MGEEGHALGRFDLVDDPIPIADRLQSDRGSRWETGEEIPDGAPLVIHPGPLDGSPLTVKHGEERVVLACPGGLGQGGRRNRPYNETASTCCTSSAQR